MTIAVPTLSAAGWVRSTSEKADMLMSHFYESDKYQTYLYIDNVTNLQWIIEQFGHDVTQLVSQLQKALEIYLGRYYDTAMVDVTYDEDVIEAPGKIRLKVVCQCTENGKVANFARLFVAMNSKLMEIAKLNN